VRGCERATNLKKILVKNCVAHATASRTDGRRVLFSSYHGRQWQELWLTTMQGAAPFPLTFGDFDRTQARFRQTASDWLYQ